MTHFYNKIKPVTEGESLFIYLAQMGTELLSKSKTRNPDYMRLSGREDNFGEYMEGVVLSFCFKRLMKIAHGVYAIKTLNMAEANNELRKQIKEWFYWLDKESIDKLMRFTFRAQQASHQKIHKDVEEDIFRSRSVHSCCFCGRRLTPKRDGVFYDDRGEKATLEHIWPQSLGGDSKIKNLLPACKTCNGIKDDLFVWQQGLIHDFIHPLNFDQSGESFEKFPVKKKILLQRRAVMIVAQRDRCTLKDAMLKVGPYGDLQALNYSDTWDFFNMQNHSNYMGETLW